MGQRFRLQAIEFIILTLMGLAAFFVGCLANAPADPSPSGPGEDGESYTIFLTGHIQSTLKPCGCSEDQLGGIEKRSSAMNSVPGNRRMAIDTGRMLRQISEQDNLKMDILFQAMNMLDYSVVNLDMQDFQAASNLGLLKNNSFELITAKRPGQQAELSSTYAKQIRLAGRKLTIQVAAIETSFPVNKWSGIFPVSGNVFNILIVDTTEKIKLDNIISKLRVDVIVCPSASTEPRILDITRTKPLIVSVGKYGEYLAGIELSSEGNKLRIKFDKIAISEKLKPDPEFVSLYQDYKNMVKDMDLLGLTAARKIPLPDGLEYLGSDSCIVCHQYSHEAWSTKAHAKAYQTLVDVDFQYDPECVQCHVIGLDYETGFASEESPADLRNVGCESCHGPGSKHVSAYMMGQKNVPLGIPKLQCSNCHTAEHSVNFDKEIYMKKIVHWKSKKIEDSGEPSDN